MRTRYLLATITVAITTVIGCGGNSAAPPKQPFAIDGKWIYLGPSDVPHDLTIDDSSMTYTDVDGKWSSKWTLKSYDDELHQFQVVFDSGSGSYLPVGQNMSGAYDLTGPTLTVQLASGFSSYPPLQNAGTCTGGSNGDPTPDCRLYIKQN